MQQIISKSQSNHLNKLHTTKQKAQIGYFNLMYHLLCFVLVWFVFIWGVLIPKHNSGQMKFIFRNINDI